MPTCNWCKEGIAPREAKVHLDGSLFHSYCVKAYLRSKGKLVKSEPWKCPAGDHYHINP